MKLLKSIGVLLVVVVMGGGVGCGVYGWGMEGHAIIGNIAERLLTADTLAKVNILTANNPLSYYASEADSWDHHVVGCRTDKCHYVSMIDPEQPVLAEINCAHRFDDNGVSIAMCAPSCLKNNTDAVRNSGGNGGTLPRSCLCTPRQIMNDPHWPTDYPQYPTPCELELIVHYVGDSHQPYHNGLATNDATDDKGGNTLCVSHTYKLAPAGDLQASSVYPGVQTDKSRYTPATCSPKQNPRDPAYANDPSYGGDPNKRVDPVYPRPDCVTVRGRKKCGCQNNIHKVWDSHLIRKLMYDNRVSSWSGLADILWEAKDSYVTVADDYTSDDDFAKWAFEAYKLSQSEAVALDCQNGQSCTVQNPKKLTLAYYTGAIEIVKRQLILAGVRLAGLLNSVFKTAPITAASYANVQCPPPARVTGEDGTPVEADGEETTGRFRSLMPERLPSNLRSPSSAAPPVRPPTPAGPATPAAPVGGGRSSLLSDPNTHYALGGAGLFLVTLGLAAKNWGSSAAAKKPVKRT